MKTSILLSVVLILASFLQLNARGNELPNAEKKNVNEANELSENKSLINKPDYRTIAVEKTITEPTLKIEPWMVSGFNPVEPLHADSSLPVEDWMVNAFRFINSSPEPSLEIEDWMKDFSKK